MKLIYHSSSHGSIPYGAVHMIKLISLHLIQYHDHTKGGHGQDKHFVLVIVNILKSSYGHSIACRSTPLTCTHLTVRTSNHEHLIHTSEVNLQTTEMLIFFFFLVLFCFLFCFVCLFCFFIKPSTKFPVLPIYICMLACSIRCIRWHFHVFCDLLNFPGNHG